MKTAGLNPVDFKTREGQLRRIHSYTLPIILGCELSGIVASVERAALTALQALRDELAVTSGTRVFISGGSDARLSRRLLAGRDSVVAAP